MRGVNNFDEIKILPTSNLTKNDILLSFTYLHNLHITLFIHSSGCV